MDLADWFLDFVVRVKNLRGIVAFSPAGDDSVLAGLQWVGKHFRYRDIGFTATTSRGAPKGVRERLGKKPFAPVQLPSVVMERIASETRPPDVEETLWLPLVTASAYACPLVLVERLEAMVPQDLWVFVARIGAPLGVASAKFHLRVCDYAALDAFGPVTKRLLAAAEEDKLVSLLHERRKMGMEDGEKRFWRLAETPGNEAVVAVLDPLGAAWAAAPGAVTRALKEHGALAAALFSLVPVFVAVPDVTVEKG